MKTKYFVVSPSQTTEFNDLGKATNHFSKLARVFPVVRMFVRENTIYHSTTKLLLEQTEFPN